MTDSAQIVIGADGRNSGLAQSVGAFLYDVVAPLTCWYFSYWSGDFERVLAIRRRDRNIIFSFPTNKDLHAIFIAWQVDAFHRVKQDVEGHFIRVLRQVPELADRVYAGRRQERFYGTADLPNFYRKPFGPGWALVGEEQTEIMKV